MFQTEQLINRFTIFEVMQPIEILSLPTVSIYLPGIPLNSREDGGHLSVEPHRVFADRSEATSQEAVELMTATMLAGAALRNVIGVEKVNYQDMGNWSINKPGAKLHIHVFGRHQKQKYQVPGESISFLPQGHPIYTECYHRFNQNEIDQITCYIHSLKDNEPYSTLLEMANNGGN